MKAIKNKLFMQGPLCSFRNMYNNCYFTQIASMENQAQKNMRTITSKRIQTSAIQPTGRHNCSFRKRMSKWWQCGSWKTPVIEFFPNHLQGRTPNLNIRVGSMYDTISSRHGSRIFFRKGRITPTPPPIVPLRPRIFGVFGRKTVPK